MIRRTSKYIALAGMISFASFGNAGTGAVTPALAACSKALIETIAKAETLPAYTVKPASLFVADTIDPNAFTVIARHGKNNTILAKASCKATPAGAILSFKSIPVKS